MKRTAARHGLFPSAILVAVLACAGAVRGQTPSPTGTSDPQVSPQRPAEPPSASIAEPPCVEPAPLMTIADYDGPFSKAAASLARKLERKTVHRPHHKPGAKLCSLDASEKFRLFVDDTVDPITFLSAGFYGGISQTRNTDSAFGQGAQGFGKRYGASLADLASSSFFGNFFYPAIFREDPRYYRRAHGSTGGRLVHAMRHTFVARSDSGKLMFNFSEWLGTASGQALSNLYHPDNQRGLGAAATGVGITVGTDMGLDVLREFWPEVSRKFKIPFIRHMPESNNNHNNHNNHSPASK